MILDSVVAIVPSYGADEQRLRNYNAVLEHLNGVVHKHTRRWAQGSPSTARNHGAAVTTENILVFNDGDSLCPHEQIREAVRLATETPGLVFAYDLYVRRTKEGRIGQTIYNSGSMACVAISRACFEQVGGFDESYVGWGYEDLDFARRCNALWPNRRVTGPVYHLWHGDRNADDSPEDSDPAQVAANEERWRALAR